MLLTIRKDRNRTEWLNHLILIGEFYMIRIRPRTQCTIVATKGETKSEIKRSSTTLKQTCPCLGKCSFAIVIDKKRDKTRQENKRRDDDDDDEDNKQSKENFQSVECLIDFVQGRCRQKVVIVLFDLDRSIDHSELLLFLTYPNNNNKKIEKLHCTKTLLSMKN